MFPMRKGILLATLLLAGCEVEITDVPSNQASSEPVRAAGQDIRPQPKFPAPTLPATAKSAESHLPFVKGFDSGYLKATESGKPMLLFFTAEWCHYCHQMAGEAFTNQQVRKLSDQFVCILIDADAEPEACKKFRVQAYPTVQFLSARGLPLNRLVGKKASNELMVAMQAALQNVARAQQDAAIKQR